ncbi:MAG: hypothetical protein KVP17_001322, partial [Porospora cf. gigantea B]
NPDFSSPIRFESVNFRYPTRTDVPIYKDINFSIHPGQTVALVGASGCGKSTAIQLLLRFYDLLAAYNVQEGRSAGSIKVGDLDIRDINVVSLRGNLGLVSQEPVLFDGSISENIQNGKLDADLSQIYEAARMANAHTFIEEQPDGYDTDVGKGGCQLSGGQKQRIAIARALIRNPKVLLLDEATSALDAESEQIVQQALDAVLASSERTTIVVAHRLSTIKNADKIVVLQNDGDGSFVAEVGNHAELVAKDGAYAQFVKAVGP